MTNHKHKTLIGRDHRPFIDHDPFKAEYWRGLTQGVGIGFITGLVVAGAFVAWMVLSAPCGDVMDTRLPWTKRLDRLLSVLKWVPQPRVIRRWYFRKSYDWWGHPSNHHWKYFSFHHCRPGLSVGERCLFCGCYCPVDIETERKYRQP